MGQDDCKSGGPTKPNYNCTIPDSDGRALQCVGPWAKEKHDYLGRYVDATRGPRAKYLESTPQRRAGGAAFIDLFAGPGQHHAHQRARPAQPCSLGARRAVHRRHR